MLHINDVKATWRQIKFKVQLLVRCNIGKEFMERSQHFLRYFQPSREAIFQIEIFHGERSGVSENNVANMGRNGKSDLDIIIQDDFIIRQAKAAASMRMQFAQFSQAIDDLRAKGTNEDPIHFKEAAFGRVEEEVNCLCFRNP